MGNTRRPALIVFLGLMLLGGRASEAQPAKIPVILDSDIGGDIDDTWALALLLRSPEFDVKLVVSDTGDTVYRSKIIARLLEVAGRADIPVGVGIRQSRDGGPQSAWVAGYELSQYPGKVHEDGVQAIIDAIKGARPESPITLICIGAMPNIREALKRAPEIASRAKFVGMHGSIRLGYGGKPKPDPEANVVNDVESTRAAFAAGWPRTITPLDTCGLVQLTGENYRKVAESKDPLARAVIENYRIWHRSQAPASKEGDAPVASSILFDTVAIHLARTHEWLTMEELPIVVGDDGITRIDPAGPRINCAMSWKDRPAFDRMLVERLTGGR
ncbi:nucleoside hydrolase [Aquisphaera insulae]|uniref:nucleoside hydrolase n=1 Tax=Aquisphaera insulae TaxID=2712864 RepID=UPI0013EB8745|nr:nucleoside hydrolase [Aquisphaera insulae]